jgi:hypothetical protein
VSPPSCPSPPHPSLFSYSPTHGCSTGLAISVSRSEPISASTPDLSRRVDAASSYIVDETITPYISA